MKKYILKGKKVIEVTDILEWARWYETADRRVAITELPGNIRVSTVFLGLNHSYHGGAPILFETMIFGGEHSEYQRRYSTWDEAEKGHQETIEMIFRVVAN